MKNSTTVIWILLLGLCLAPFLYFFQYSFAAADDFCAFNFFQHNNNSTESWKMLYQTYNGRYSANFILSYLDPIQLYFSHYPQILLVQFSIFLISIWFFVRTLTLNHSLPGIFHLLISLLLSVIFLYLIPDTGEGLYWVSGSVAYLSGSSFLVLFLSFCIRWYNNPKNTLFSICLLLLLVAMGFNEVQSTIIPLGLAMGIIYLWIKKIKIPYGFYLLFLTALILAVVVYSAPGNFNRINQYENNFSWLNSFFMSGLQTIRFMFYWIFNPVYLIGMLVLINIFSSNPSIERSSKHLYFFLVLTLLCIFLSAFLPYLGTGILGQHRTMNWSLVIFILFSIYLSIQIASITKWQSIFQSSRVKPFLPLLFLVSFLLFHNGKKASLDLYYSYSKNNYADFLIRNYGLIHSSPDTKIIRVCREEAITYSFDVDSVQETWMDSCLKDTFFKNRKTNN